MLAMVQDYPNTLNRSIALDARILGDASAMSSHYADLVSLAARQTMTSTELTIGNGDPPDIKMFMKNIGSGTTSCDLSV